MLNLNDLYVTVYIYPPDAVQAGHARGGKSELLVPQDVLQTYFADPELRKRLSRYAHERGKDSREYLSLGAGADPRDPWPAVVSYLQGELDKERRAQDLATQNRERAITEWLAKPDEEVIYWGWHRDAPRVTNPSEGDSDPRVRARVAALQPLLAAKLAEWEKYLEDEKEIEALKVAQEAAQEARREEARAQVRAWAMAQPDCPYVRAAKEDYDVHEAVIGWIATRLVASVGPGFECVLLKEGTSEWHHWGWEERGAPATTAFTALDEVKKAVAALARPDCVKVEVLRVQRVTHDGEGEDYEKFTAIAVTITCPGAKDRALIVPVE
jgi:hypothetical protein